MSQKTNSGVLLFLRPVHHFRRTQQKNEEVLAETPYRVLPVWVPASWADGSWTVSLTRSHFCVPAGWVSFNRGRETRLRASEHQVRGLADLN